MKQSIILSVSAILVMFLGIVTVSCNGKGKPEPLGIVRIKYFISEYFTVADASSKAIVYGTMWEITLHPQKRITIDNSPELYKAIAKERGEDGTKEYEFWRPPYSVPYNISKISVYSDSNDVSKEFDISFESLKNGIKEKNGKTAEFKAELSLITIEDLKWLVDKRFLIAQKGVVTYPNLVMFIELTDGEKIECKLLE